MGGSTSPEPPKSIFRKIFKKSRSDNDVSANTRRTEHPPPYRHETISPPLISPRQQELSREGRAPGSPPSPLVTTPSLRLLPPSSNKDHARSRSKDRRQEPQGLKAVYEPPEERTADIVFVHGLGGSSITTWSKDQDGTAFWPEAFLSREPVLSTARIFTFGYTAFYWDTNAAGSLSITDFARSLLANLKNAHEMSFGEVPIIFVAHSLGGLVVKKAYIMGRFSDTFKDIISSVSAMVFLGTPHYGSGLAKSLNRLLAATIIGPAPKQYVADLDEKSTAIEDLNEQFRNVPSELQIASFYETKFTMMGLSRLMIVDKNSSIIGCRGEVPQPLDADHHNLCKYDSPNDDNYVRVRNVLYSLVAPLVNLTSPSAEPASNALEKTSALLGISSSPEDDFNFYLDRWMANTCSWISGKDSILHKWTHDPTRLQTLWISGPPGTGKSVLAAYLINYLRSQGIFCVFHFFRSGDRLQRSIGACIRSIAFQIATQFSRYKQQLDELSDAGTQLQRNDARSLWQKLFLSTLGQLDVHCPIYVVIDGLDESDSLQTLLSLFASAAGALPFRFIIISRPTQSISNALDKFSEPLRVERISTNSASEDIPIYVNKELQSIRASSTLRQKIIDLVIDKAAGNFLWVHLAVNEILNCHTQDEIEQVLHDIPSDMQLLYRRIEDSMTESLKAMDQKLAKALLMWIGCAQRVLTLDEVAEALEPTFGNILDLAYTIRQICGSLILVDRNSRVTFVHQTVREYLIKLSKGPFAISPSEAHEEIFLRCMSCIGDSELRAHIKQDKLSPLVPYAATSWHFHLRAIQIGSDDVFYALSTFLEETTVLTWIHVLAMWKQLRVLVQTSQSLASFVERRKVHDACIAPNLRPTEALESMDLWSTDLVKIVGKFGKNLLETPEAIHKFIPQFCPRTSAINRQFGKRGAFQVRVPGEANSAWDDSLAKIFLGSTAEGLSIACAGRFFAVLTTANSIILYDAETCQELRRLQQSDKIMVFCVSKDGKLIASYGVRSTKIWETGTGREIHSLQSPSQSKALHIRFVQQSLTIMVSSEDRNVRMLSIEAAEPAWQKKIDLQSLDDQVSSSGIASRSPHSTAISPDGGHVALAFRGAPLSVWALADDQHLVGRCRRERGDLSFDSQPWSPVDQVLWPSASAEVLGIYTGGAIFKWNPLEDTSQEVDASANTIACNHDGDLVASTDANGTIRIWKIQDFSLIYQLRYESPVSGLAFGPDNRRFYDLRGAFCNVWEPNTLIRLSDLEKSGSEAASDFASVAASTTMSEAEVEIKEPVTAIASSNLSHTYVSGNAEGGVRLQQSFGEKQTELWSSSAFMPIEHVAWSKDGKHVAWRDLASRVMVKAVDATKSSQPPTEPLFDKTIVFGDGPVQQLLLSPKSEYILITSPTSAQLFSIGQSSRIQEWKSTSSNAAFRWVNHPSCSDQLLVIGAERAFIFSWQDLAVRREMQLDLRCAFSSTSSNNVRLQQIRRPSDSNLILNRTGTIVEHVMLTQDKKHVLLEATYHEPSTPQGSRQLALFSKATFDGADTLLAPRSLPSALLSKVQLPLGVLPYDRFVFLDNEYWICSWQLSGVKDEALALKRYFFLPRDWLSAECIELCKILDNGVLLIPRQGEVASIKSDLSLQW